MSPVTLASSPAVTAALGHGDGDGGQVEMLLNATRQSIFNGQFTTAVLWSDKLLQLRPSCDEARFLAVHSLNLSGDVAGACHLIRDSGWHKTSPIFAYLAAKLLFESAETLYTDAFNLLDDSFTNESPTWSLSTKPPCCQIHRIPGYIENLPGAVYLLAAKMMQQRSRTAQAIVYYKRALEADPTCYEAFNQLFEQQLLAREDLENVNISIGGNLSKQQRALVTNVYDCRLYVTASVATTTVPAPLQAIAESPDARLVEAKRLYNVSKPSAAFEVVSDVLCRMPQHRSALLLAISILTEGRSTTELFNFASRLAQNNVKDEVTLFAAGCYHLSGGRHDEARRAFDAATRRDPTFGAAWLAKGHSFSMLAEHDYAMSAYTHAQQCMGSSHLAMLYLGVEHAAAGSSNVAQQFFARALELAPRNAHCLHEAAIAHFHNRKYDLALSSFELAELAMQESRDSTNLFALYNNLGHCYRKMKRYSKAVEYHQKAEMFCPRKTLNSGPVKATCLTPMALAYALCGDSTSAMHVITDALCRQEGDQVAQSLRDQILELMEKERQDSSVLDDLDQSQM